MIREIEKELIRIDNTCVIDDFQDMLVKVKLILN